MSDVQKAVCVFFDLPASKRRKIAYEMCGIVIDDWNSEMDAYRYFMKRLKECELVQEFIDKMKSI